MKTIQGKVVSIGMTKTVVIETPTQRIHPLYKKIMRATRRYKAHCEDTTILVGDMVEIQSCRPLSKEKHFRVLKKI